MTLASRQGPASGEQGALCLSPSHDRIRKGKWLPTTILWARRISWGSCGWKKPQHPTPYRALTRTCPVLLVPTVHPPAFQAAHKKSDIAVHAFRKRDQQLLYSSYRTLGIAGHCMKTAPTSLPPWLGLRWDRMVIWRTSYLVTAATNAKAREGMRPHALGFRPVSNLYRFRCSLWWGWGDYPHIH